MLRNPVKRKLSSSALFNLLHVHFHGNIFFLTNSNEYLIRKQLRTFTSMQSYFQLKKNTAQHFETFDTLDLYMSGFLYSFKKNIATPQSCGSFQIIIHNFIIFSNIKHTAIKRRGRKIWLKTFSPISFKKQ